MNEPHVNRLLEAIQTSHFKSTVARTVFTAFIQVAVATVVLHTFVTVGWSKPPLFLSIAFAVAGLVGVIALRYPRRLTPVEAARLVDDTLDLRDRLTTFVEWRDEPSPLLPWLRRDVVEHTRTARPEHVVPSFSIWEERTRYYTLTGMTVILLSFVPIPTGLFTKPPETVSIADMIEEEVDDLIEETTMLREEIRSLPRPAYERLDRDLAALQLGLRDRSIPRDEATTLLRYMQGQVQLSLDGHRSPLNTAKAPLSPDQVRRISQHFTTPSHDASSPHDRTEGDESIQDDFDRADGESHPTGDASRGDGETDHRQAERSSDRGDERADAEGTPGAQQVLGLPTGGAEASEERGDFEGATAVGDGIGDEGTDMIGIAHEAEAASILHHLPGEDLGGPVHTGQVQTDLRLNVDAVAEDGTPPGGPLPESGNFQAGVRRETIPLSHQELIRQYFATLEPERK